MRHNGTTRNGDDWPGDHIIDVAAELDAPVLVHPRGDAYEEPASRSRRRRGRPSPIRPSRVRREVARPAARGRLLRPGRRGGGDHRAGDGGRPRGHPRRAVPGRLRQRGRSGWAHFPVGPRASTTRTSTRVVVGRTASRARGRRGPGSRPCWAVPTPNGSSEPRPVRPVQPRGTFEALAGLRHGHAACWAVEEEFACLLRVAARDGNTIKPPPCDRRDSAATCAR